MRRLIGVYFQRRSKYEGSRCRTQAHLHVGVVEPQPVGLAQLGGVLQRLHDGQEVAAVGHTFVRGGPEARDDLCKLFCVLPRLRFGDVVS